MASTDRPTIHIHSTEDLLALIPFILGFQPDASLVLVAMRPRRRPVRRTNDPAHHAGIRRGTARRPRHGHREPHRDRH